MTVAGTRTAAVPNLLEARPIPTEAIASLRDNGHAVVRGLASEAEVATFRPAVEAAVRKHAEGVMPLAERKTYGKAFLQVHNLWRFDETVKAMVFAPRFAKAAADLMGVPAVRLYHDQALCKEPSGGHTPWHQDQGYWPLDTQNTVTMWMPLVDIPARVGSMTFATGSHQHGNLGPWLIGDESEESFQALVEERGFPLHTYGAMKAGDATFHKGWTLHRAGSNDTDLFRLVMTVIWYADGTRISQEPGKGQQFDHRAWLDSRPGGSLADGPLNPRLWPPKDAA